jgi:uncharacterized protein YdhG (YjbR/CyaY superfamily)
VMATRAKPVDAYIAKHPREVQKLLKAIRLAVRKVAPDAEESISYGIPTFKLAGKPLIYFAAHKEHIGMYPMTGAVREKFEKELAKYDGSKGTVRFPLDAPLPLAFITRVVRFRAKEIQAKSGKRR